MAAGADEARVKRAAEAVWRIDAARLIAGLARLVRDLGTAEDLAQEALVAALERWPRTGIPDNPGAWLAATARHLAVDRIRREQIGDRKTRQLGWELERTGADPADPAADDPFHDDDLLRLVFMTCHPVLSLEARVALTLRLLCGLTTVEIARAHLASEATVAQRIVRAKRTLAEARVEFAAPGASQLPARLAAVLEVVYLVFNEGYAATSGDRWIRPELVSEALRLGRVLAGILPDQPEVHGLVSLMELSAARTRARTTPSGEPVALLAQDRSAWDWVLVGRGLAALERVHALGRPLGPYALQAAIAACHARARVAERTDWERIVVLYDALAQVAPSPVVDLNRAMAVSMADGPEPALAIVDGLRDVPSLRGYHLLAAARGDLLERLGRVDEAREEFRRAAGLTANERERSRLLERARS